MRACVRLAAAGVLAALLAATAYPAAPEKFAGTWEATAKGTVFLVLKIRAGAKITGTMKSGPIRMNEKGELLEVGPPEVDENPIFFAQVEGDKLIFNSQDDEEDVMQFELILKGGDTAELRIIDKDHPDLKGFALKRAKA
jgi:hypothetical protein